MRLFSASLACAASWAVLVARTAHGDDSDLQAYELDYEAPEACPPRERVRADLEARGVPVATSVSVRALVVRITRVGTRYRGKLVLRENSSEGAQTERQLEAPDCAELSGAIVLIAGLLTQADPAEPPARLQPARPAQTPDPIRSAGPPTAAEQPPAPADRRRSRPRLALGAGVLAHGGVAPGLGYGGLVFAELRGVRTGLFLPAVRLGAGFATSESDRLEGSARLDWLAARTWFSPWRWPEGPIGLELSSVLEVGRLRATATRANNPTNRSGTWIAAGVEAALDAELGPFSLVLAGGVVVPLMRDRFYLEPTTTLHRTPSVAEMGRLAAVVRF